MPTKGFDVVVEDMMVCRNEGRVLMYEAESEKERLYVAALTRMHATCEESFRKLVMTLFMILSL